MSDLKMRLLANRVIGNTGEVEIEGVGTVTVRGLTRYEFAMLGKKYPEAGAEQEQETLALAMVDPPMTVAEVAEWQRSSPATEINEVATEINRLSGIGRAAEKEAYKSTGE